MGARLGPVLLLAATLCPASVTGRVVINELMADNESFVEDPERPGEFDDWVELHNDGDEPAGVGGMYLTDDVDDRTRWRIPDGTVIPAGGHLVLWADGQPEQGPLHMPFRLSAGGETVMLVGRDGVTPVDSIRFESMQEDVSLGRFPDGGDRWLVMREPTPGAANVVGQATAVEFSAPGGTFTGELELELRADSPDATILYTLDGTEPREADALRYTGPIRLDATTRVRARALEDGLLPGVVSSEAYLALDESVLGFESNLPIVVIDTLGVDIDSLTARPRRFRTVLAAFIDTSGASRRAAIGDRADFAGHGGLHVRGSSTVQYPKKQYAFETRDEEDRDRDVSLLGLPAESDWVLHAPYSDKTLMRNHLMYLWSNRAGRYAPRTRFCEVLMTRRGRPISMADYRGVYVLMERIKRGPDRVDIAPLRPEHGAEPEITGGYLLKKDWIDGEMFFTTSTYRDNLIYVDPAGAELTGPQRAWLKRHFDEFERALAGPRFADPQLGYARYIDVDSFSDHHHFVELARNVDGFVLSTFLSKERDGKIAMGPIWDYNGALGGANYFCACQTAGWHHQFDERDCRECAEGGATFPADNPNGYRWYTRLFEDPAFRRRHAERWGDLRAGPLRTDRLLADIENVVDLLTDGGAPENAVTRNFTRWRILDTFVWPNFFVRGTHEEHVAWMREWVVDRLAWMDGQLTVPPALEPPGGEVARGTEVTISAPSGDVFYTINGPDPRGDDDEPAPEAVRFEEPIVITANTRIRARARLSSDLWSEAVEGVYVTDTVSVAITEIMYNPAPPPAGSPFSRRNFEFVELLNTGRETANLAGFAFTGRLRFEFPESDASIVAPGAHVLVVESVEAFGSRYDASVVTIAGEFEGILANTSQEIVLEGSVGEPVLRFTYRDWYPETDGAGHSLVLVDPTSPPETWSDAAAWRPSESPGGSPGRADSDAGRQLPADVNQDGRLNISDAVETLRALFAANGRLPCATEEANTALADANGDGRVDLSDAVRVLGYLFSRGEPPVAGTGCVVVVGCPDICTGE